MPLKVYYLDDEPDLLEIFSDTLSNEMVEVTTFLDPNKFVTAVSSQPPDLVFLDFRLPSTTGLDIARKLDPDIPKAMVTGDLAVKADPVFTAYFEKPIKFLEVQVFIQKFINVKAS